MSLRYEQFRALHSTRRFLYDILERPLKSWSAPELKQRASRCLRHYPYLDRTGAPMWSKDDFPCPDLEDEQ